jgi:predicted AAA+ superfamily ATPase
VVVLDGNELSPSQPRRHGSITARTLWGDLACQLGGEEAYALVAKADEDGTSPGKAVLKQLFDGYAPCVILMDEMVAYARQFESGRTYPGGTFDSVLSFIQALTEAAAASPRTAVLASLPESNLEVGGEQGKRALESLEKYFGRIEAIWKPVATEEAFEIVRRRLFGTLTDTTARDAVCRAFADLYHQHTDRFPSDAGEARYLQRLKDAYPIHPEVFERLYEDWASLEKFQRTRGVLRLMALVIHRLWSDDNRDLLILPGSLPASCLDAPSPSQPR